MDQLLINVNTYINDHIYHSRLWDAEDDKGKTKAMNQARETLTALAAKTFPSKEDIPVEDVAQQALWILKLDDTFQRAEMGVTSLSIDGTSIQMRQMDRHIAPFITNKYGISTTKKRKVGSYSLPIQDTAHIRGGV